MREAQWIPKHVLVRRVPRPGGIWLISHSLKLSLAQSNKIYALINICMQTYSFQ